MHLWVVSSKCGHKILFMIYEMNASSCQQPLAYKWTTFIICLIFCSCTAVKFTKTVPGQPQASYYSFNKGVALESLKEIDTTIIYVNGKDWVRTYQSGKIEKVFSYQYLKFNSNGTAFFSGDSKEPFNGI